MPGYPCRFGPPWLTVWQRAGSPRAATSRAKGCRAREHRVSLPCCFSRPLKHAMKPRSVLSMMVAAPAALLLLLPLSSANALSLFGFGSSDSTAEEAKARAAAIALIKENAAADEFVPPAVGVGRRDAARFEEARRAGGKLVCSGDSAPVEITWDRVNDDFCDCPGDGGDEPGTSACSNGAFLLFCFLTLGNLDYAPVAMHGLVGRRQIISKGLRRSWMYIPQGSVMLALIAP